MIGGFRRRADGSRIGDTTDTTGSAMNSSLALQSRIMNDSHKVLPRSLCILGYRQILAHSANSQIIIPSIQVQRKQAGNCITLSNMY